MKKQLCIYFVISALSCGGAAALAEHKPGAMMDTRQPVAGSATVPATAKCAVCGMFVAKFPNWAASVRFTDGTTSYYDGPKDMFTHYIDITRYTPGKHQADIVTLSVREYYSLAPIDARTAFFVIGSDIIGPMGNELIPFQNEKDALAFKVDHKGKRVLRFNDITPQIIKSLK
jgi:nitrous oxide reductase accessory protein NosL